MSTTIAAFTPSQLHAHLGDLTDRTLDTLNHARSLNLSCWDRDGDRVTSRPAQADVRELLDAIALLQDVAQELWAATEAAGALE